MIQTFNARDFMSIASRTSTEEGFLIAPSSLARTGVQEYRAYELGLDADGIDPMRVIRLHRPAEEVFDQASMASFENKPITIEHPPVAVTADNWRDFAAGEVRDVGRFGDLLTGTLLVKSKDAIEAIQAGKVQLSNGYTFELDMTSGITADGQAYDGIQRKIRGNHVALVDSARCGSACRLGDAMPREQAPNSLTGRESFLARQTAGWKQNTHDGAQPQGAELFEERKSGQAAKPFERHAPAVGQHVDEEKPSGRAAFMQRQQNGWKQPQGTDDKATTPAAKTQQTAVWRGIRPDGGGV